MVKYYWNRYNANPIYDYKLDYIPFDGTSTSLDNRLLNDSTYAYYKNIQVSNGGTLTVSLDVTTTVGLDRGTILYRKHKSNGQITIVKIVNIDRNKSTAELEVRVLNVNQEIEGYTQGTLVVANIQADANAYVNNARNSDGYWYVRGGVVNTAPTYTQIPAQSVRKNTTASITLSNYFRDAEGNALTYTASSSNNNVATVTIASGKLTVTGTSIGSATITVTASDGSLSTSQTFAVTVANTAPTVTVSQPSANVTLYENDTLQIAGAASDIDTNQSITIYAQVNNEQRIVLGVGLSNAQVAFGKQLKFVGGKLYDGDTAITGSLTDGTPHTINIWAQDGDGAQSSIIERSFYVVPNRPPVLTIDAVQTPGIINTDKFTISGGASDPDGNPVTAIYRVNGGNRVALEITEGHWAFDIALGQLVVGQNTIVVELVDSYNFKVSKTIKLNKETIKTPILQSVARYKIEPPKKHAKGVLLWIQRDIDLDLVAELSMTLAGEQEQYVTLIADHTAPVSTGIVEDEFYHEADEPKNNIILKLSTKRPSVEVNNKIYLISGVLE